MQAEPRQQVSPESEGAAAPELEEAIERAVAFIRSQQLPSGAWISEELFEPRTSAVHLVTMAFVDRLAPVDARGYARYLASTQLEDGSFPPYPFAPQGDLSATALVFAALHVAGLDEHEEARGRALRFIESRGGLSAAVRLLYERGDLCPVYLAMAGLVDPFELPDPELSFMIVPGALDVMLRKINAGIVEVMIFVAAVTRALRHQLEPPGMVASHQHQAEAARCLAFYESWLNPNGNNNGTTVQTDQAIATLVALGRSPESTSVHSAISWFDKHKIWDERGLHLRAFFNHNWMTSLCLRALLFAGVERDDPMVHDALDFMVWSQSKLPMPELNLRREDAVRAGGWGFEDDNLILPDTDDTGAVLGALGIALHHDDHAALGRERLARVRGAVDLGLPNLLDMQSDNGGWAAFVWNLGDKPAGAIFDEPIRVPETTLDKLKMFLAPPVELGEPAVSGLTGRVLQGLGALGYSPHAAVVRDAATFLRKQQTPSGAWWGRWFVAYLPATTCAISGLADCGWDMSEPWIQKAIRWLLSCQNDDGGWGETPVAYDDPERIGEGPSMPPLTGHVLIGLLDAGLGDHPAVARGVDYLLRTQQDSGRWPGEGWLQVYEPNSTYYYYDGAAWYAPLEALAKYRRHRAGEALGARRHSAVFARVDEAPDDPRQQGDPLADAVIASIHERSEQSLYRQAVGRIGTLGDPLPESLPPAAKVYFHSTQSLPAWADHELIARGQRLFREHSWLMSLTLLASSLPQSYAAANGARLLAQTQGMTRNVHGRILNTAQFMFDVCEVGGLAPEGRGIRSAQKIRLTHAAVRAMMRRTSGWDSDSWGVPVNQADLLGTALVFSVVLIDGLERAGIEVSGEDEEAFLHLWMVVAHLLGLHDVHRPRDRFAAREAMQRFRAKEWLPSPQGKLLAEQLVACMRHYFPGKSPRIPRALIRFLAGNRCAETLQVPLEPAAAALLEAAVATGALADMVEPMLQRYGGRFTKAAIDVQRRGKPVRFWFPTALFKR